METDHPQESNIETRRGRKKMPTTDKPGKRYPEVLAALGRFIAKNGMSDVCIMEFENGVIVTGSVLYETGEDMNRYIATHILSHSDLARLVKEA
jgi:hypothetical protein